jgi:putative tryptophan/tyrosine transport system substrate-binding protein
MRRRQILELVGGAACALLLIDTPVAANGHKRRVLVVSIPGELAYWQPFFERLQQLGYVDGSTVVFDYWLGAGRGEGITQGVADLVRRRPDAIVTAGIRETQAAAEATTTIPITMTLVPDAVALGFADSLARPGRNLTGLNTSSIDLVAKRFEILKEAVPTIQRVAVLGSPLLHYLQDPQSPWAEQLRAAGRSIGIEVSFVTARDVAEFERAFAQMRAADVQGVVVMLVAEYVSFRRELAEVALRHGMPTIFEFVAHAEAGGLLVYAAKASDLMRRAADYVSRVLQGAKADDLPIELPTRFELVINLKTARALGLTIPPTLLARADEVIE